MEQIEYIIVTETIKKELRNINSKQDYIMDLVELEKYLTNKYYNVYGKDYPYIHNTKNPYFHGFTIDKLRKKYSNEYDKMFNDLKK